MKTMTTRPSKIAVALTGWVLTASVLATTAFATPQTKKKTPPAKGGTKVDKVALDAGHKVYDANGCGGCHKIGDKGGASGPNLTHVAKNAKHTPAWLETHVVNPKAINPYSSMPAYKESIKGKDLKNLVAYLGSLK